MSIDKILHTAKIVTINFLILFILLIITELIFGSWLYSSKNFKSLLIPKQKSDLLDSLPYEFSNIGKFTRDQYGFRANNYKLTDINILVLGGSTTEEREVDDNLIWTKVFEKNLNKNLKVLNAGIGGQTSYGHGMMYDLWFSKYKDLKPDYILVFLGINDTLNLIETLEKDEIDNTGRNLNNSNRDLLINLEIKHKFIQYIKNNSAIHTLFQIIKGNIISRKYNISYNNKPTEYKIYQEDKPFNLEDLNTNKIENFKKIYFNNLNKLISVSETYNSKLIFIDQIISKQHWLYPYLKQINKYTLEFCKNHNLFCINLSSKLNKFNNNFFYDGMHTTPEGSKIIGEMVADSFNNYLFN